MPANLCRYVFFSYLIHNVWSSGALLEFNSTVVYSGRPVKLTCTYRSGILVLAMVMAHNGSHREAMLWCDVESGITHGLGHFDGIHLTGCPSISSGVKSYSMTLTATPSLELTYDCGARVFDGSTTLAKASRAISLKVLVCPLAPTISKGPLVFDENDSVRVTCDSRNGKPAALISLTITSSSGEMLTAHGTETATLELPLPVVDWHNALVSCDVTNHHNCSSMSATNNLMINHIKAKGEVDAVYTNAKKQTTLDCSAYISSYPCVQYRWAVPRTAVAEDTSNLSGPLFNVLPGQSGMFNCTATNNVTGRSIVVVFFVRNTTTTTIATTATTANPSATNLNYATTVIALIMVIVAGTVVFFIIAILVFVLYKRGHFTVNGLSKQKTPGVEQIATNERSCNGCNCGATLLSTPCKQLRGFAKDAKSCVMPIASKVCSDNYCNRCKALCCAPCKKCHGCAKTKPGAGPIATNERPDNGCNRGEILCCTPCKKCHGLAMKKSSAAEPKGTTERSDNGGIRDTYNYFKRLIWSRHTHGR